MGHGRKRVKGVAHRGKKERVGSCWENEGDDVIGKVNKVLRM